MSEKAVIVNGWTRRFAAWGAFAATMALFLLLMEWRSSSAYQSHGIAAMKKIDDLVERDNRTRVRMDSLSIRLGNLEAKLEDHAGRVDK